MSRLCSQLKINLKSCCSFENQFTFLHRGPRSFPSVLTRIFEFRVFQAIEPKTIELTKKIPHIIIILHIFDFEVRKSLAQFETRVLTLM